MGHTEGGAGPTPNAWGNSRLTRRQVMQAGALMALLAACRNTSDGTGTTGGEPSGTAGTSGAAASGTRMVETPRGSVEVPADPKRVAALVGSADVDVLAFGIEPVYSSSFATGWIDLPDSTEISDAIPPEVEAVAATSPDLMIGWNWLADEPSWKQLEKIAPAVALPEEYTGPDYWRDVFLVLADYVNRQDEGAALLADYDARVGELAAASAGRDPVTVSHIRVWQPGLFDWNGHDADAAGILESVGIVFEGPDVSKDGVSIERLDDVTAPTLLLEVLDEKAAEEMLSGPIWPTLPAVQADQVIEVDGALWGGYGYLWAKAMVDEIERMFFS